MKRRWLPPAAAAALGGAFVALYALAYLAPVSRTLATLDRGVGVGAWLYAPDVAAVPPSWVLRHALLIPALCLFAPLCAPVGRALVRPAAGAEKRWGYRRVVAVVAVVAGLGAALVCRYSLGLEGHVWDERELGFQARIFAAGRLTAVAPPTEVLADTPAGRNNFLVGLNEGWRPGKWFTIYMPVWPLALAAGELVGRPWLVNPFLGMLTAFVLFGYGRRLVGDDAAFLASLLYALSPFVLFNNASFFSEPVFLLLALLFLWAMDLGKERGTFAPNAAAGFLAALAFGAREYSALAVLLPAGIWWVADVVRGRRRLATLAYCALGAACGAAPLLLYNAAVTGAPLRFPRVYTSKVHLGLDAEFVRHYMAYITTRRLWVFITDVAGWPLVSLVPALLPLFFRDLPRAVRLLYFVGLLAVLQFVVGQHLGLDYGARYYYPALPAVFLGGAWGWITLARRLAAPGRWPAGTAAAAGVLLIAGATIPYVVALEPVYRNRWAFPDNARPWVTPELAHALAVLNVRDALVFVSPPERCDGPPPNDAELRHRLLFARDRGPRNREFARLYPRARYLRCSYGLFEQTGYLEELTFYNLQPAGRKRP